VSQILEFGQVQIYTVDEDELQDFKDTGSSKDGKDQGDGKGSASQATTTRLRKLEEFFRSRRVADQGSSKDGKDQGDDKGQGDDKDQGDDKGQGDDTKDDDKFESDEDAASMQIFVTMPTGTTITLDVVASDTINMLKAMIYGKEGIPRNQQRLIFKEMELESGRLSDAGVKDGSTLLLLLRILGAGKRARMVSLEEEQEAVEEDFTPLEDDAEAIRNLLMLKEVSVHKMLTAMSLKELKHVSESVSSERNGDRIISFVASQLAERRSAERQAIAFIKRLELARTWSQKLIETSMQTEAWLTDGAFECKRFKSYLQGLVTVAQQSESLSERMSRMRVG
jgi:ubiquitin